MAKIHTSGKNTSPKVPYQKPVHGHTIIRPVSEEAAEEAKRHFKEHPLTLSPAPNRSN